MPRPPCFSGTTSIAARTKFSTRQTMLIFIGVCVSPSAKNARARMLTDENATSPGARHISASAARSVESAVNLPCSKISRTIGWASTTSKTAAIKIQKEQRAQPVPQRAAKLGIIFLRRQTGQRRQQIRRQRDAEHALR